MSHHSGSEPFPGTPEELQRMKALLRSEQAKLQGEYPEGRLNTDDEGAVALSVGHEKGKVIITFAHPTAWIGFTPEQAAQLAQSVLDHARAAGLIGYTIRI
jgi:hypothetical protein